jgi:hypothetical protein
MLLAYVQTHGVVDGPIAYIYITVSLQYHASKPLNSYCEVILCVMCLLAIIPNPC